MPTYTCPYDTVLVSALLREASGKTFLGTLNERDIIPERITHFLQLPSAEKGFRVMGISEGPDVHLARMHHVPERVIK